MFTCHDMALDPGKTNFDVDLIRFWQKRDKDQLRTWNLAVAYAISRSKMQFKDFKPLLSSFRQGRAFQHYLQKNPSHYFELSEIVEKVENAYNQDWIDT